MELGFSFEEGARDLVTTVEGDEELIVVYNNFRRVNIPEGEYDPREWTEWSIKVHTKDSVTVRLMDAWMSSKNVEVKRIPAKDFVKFLMEKFE